MSVSSINFLNINFFIENKFLTLYIPFNTYRLYLKFMTIQINYKNRLKESFKNIVLFTDERFNINWLEKIYLKPMNFHTYQIS